MSVKVAIVPAELQRLANPSNVAGMARFGMGGKKLPGIPVAQLRAMAKQTSRDHDLAVGKKGVNWTLRQIGKRNRVLNRQAIQTAKRDSRAARWIAAGALRELERWKPR